MGAVRKAVIVVAVLLVAVAYWLYEPVPSGYSASSTRKLRALLAGMKVFDAAYPIATALGYGERHKIARAFMESSAQGLAKSSDASVRAEDTILDNVPVRIYTPTETSGIVPGFVYYHGGGWTTGGLESYNQLIWYMTKKLQVVLVSVNYRLAPEHIFPAGFDDCVAATKFFVKNAKQYSVDPNRIGIGGDSAGGNLAAAVALKLRDENFKPEIKMQILIYPSLQFLNFQLPSMLKNAPGPVLTYEALIYFVSMYLDGNTGRSAVYQNNSHVPSSIKKKMATAYLNVDHLPKKYLTGYTLASLDNGDENLWREIEAKMLNSYLSPLVARDLTRLPMTYLLTCEHDVLRDDGILYAYRLNEAGNAVTHVNGEIAFHGIISFHHILPEADAMLEEILKFIKTNL